MNSKRDFPHQQGSYSSLSPGHYEYKELMPKQSYCMKGTFGN